MRLAVHLSFLLIFTLKCHLAAADEIWEQDLSEEVEIGASTEGYDHVRLFCAVEEMIVDVETTEEFTGVIYTRGSFHSRRPSCFLDPLRGRNFTMKIPFDDCRTKKDGEKYSNIVVIQHDDELITPGDAAFVVECDFSKPEVHTVIADVNGAEKRKIKSSISLVDADPGKDRSKRAAYVESETEEVTFIPSIVPKVNDEL